MSEHHERHLFLSPHYDDIPLSCGGTVALLTSRGLAPEVALLFGDIPDPARPLSPFAQRLHREWGLAGNDVIAARRSEEADAARILGYQNQFLPFRDAIYRNDAYDSDSAIFGGPLEEDAGVPLEVVAALELDGETKNSTFLYAPLAIGRHVDHQVAYMAGRELHRAGFTVRFYEDLPYALNERNYTTRLAELGDRVTPADAVAVEEVWETKIDAIMAYPSQLQVIFETYVGVNATRAVISEEMLRYATSTGNSVAVEQYWRAS